MRGSIRSLSVLSAASLVATCSDIPTEPSRTSDASFAVGGSSLPSLNLYGLGGLARAVPRSPCADGPYRQFDFWIGDWDVFNPAGALAGTNTITNELDGCLIAEDWTGSGGVRGRSINTYDAETGLWHQTWVSGFTIGHLRMSGGLVNGEMVLEGLRVTPFGLQVFDEFTWTVLAPDRVRQVGELRIPAFDVVNTFTGIYERVDAVTPLPETQTTECAPGAISGETRRLDFMVGDWSVELENGRLLGRSSVRTDLSNCLFEERFTTRKEYEAVAFTYWDRVVGSWYRTYIDSEGERLELAGGFDGDRLVLQGTDGVPGGTVELRLTLAPRSDGGVDQVFELSRDGGRSWRTTLSLRFVD